MITRDAPTKDAHMNMAVYAPPKMMMVMAEKQKAADVCTIKIKRYSMILKARNRNNQKN